MERAKTCEEYQELVRGWEAFAKNGDILNYDNLSPDVEVKLVRLFEVKPWAFIMALGNMLGHGWSGEPIADTHSERRRIADCLISLAILADHGRLDIATEVLDALSEKAVNEG